MSPSILNGHHPPPFTHIYVLIWICLTYAAAMHDCACFHCIIKASSLCTLSLCLSFYLVLNFGNITLSNISLVFQKWRGSCFSYYIICAVSTFLHNHKNWLWNIICAMYTLLKLVAKEPTGAKMSIIKYSICMNRL